MSQKVSNKWTPRQIKYAHWKANPYREETKEKFAETININRKTLQRWDKLDGFTKFVDSLIDDYVGDDEADIWRALIKSAKSEEGSTDRKLFFQLRGKLIEKTDTRHKFDDKVEKVNIEIIQGKNGTKPKGD